MKLNDSEIASLGASLRKIEPKILKPCQNKDTKRIWLQGGEPYFDIFLELTKDEIIWFQFTLRGKSLSWQIDKNRLKTGETHELEIDDVSFHPASKVIDNDYSCDLKFVNLVKAILQTRANEEIFGKVLKLLLNAEAEFTTN